MSGHSKWAQIKYKKGIADAKKGQIFSKLARIITINARKGGPDPNLNSLLREAIDKARSFNLPNENIERAIKRGAGTHQEKLEELMLEAYGPEGVALLIETITDNKNRTLGEIRNILTKFGGKLATVGSVLWLFERVGQIAIKVPKSSQEELELEAIEAGAQDIKKEPGAEEKFVILTKAEELEVVKTRLAQYNLTIESSGFDFRAKTPVTLTGEHKQKFESLIGALDEHDDVQEIYSNAILV